MSRSTAMTRGTAPPQARLVAVFRRAPSAMSDTRLEDWALWSRYRGATKEWLSLKLSACGARPEDDGWAMGKANYWLGWSPIEMRGNRHRDWGLLQKYRSELHEAVLEALESLSADDWAGHIEPHEMVLVPLRAPTPLSGQRETPPVRGDGTLTIKGPSHDGRLEPDDTDSFEPEDLL